MDLEILYPLLTEAIRRAETLDDLKAPGALAAYLDFSLLEEKVAEIVPASNPEGALARRGAVRAALSARAFARAQQLSERFLAEVGNNADLRTEILQLSEQAERSMAKRYPHVVASVGMLEVRRLARAFIQQGAPFPIG
jgi:hypothetical protein